MKKETAKYIRLVYGILLGVMTVAAGICLMAGCLSIYRSGGEQIYTAEKVAAAFVPVSGPIYTWLVMVILGFILDFALPTPPKKLVSKGHYGVYLDRHLTRVNVDTAPEEVKQGIFKERQLRRWDQILSFSLLGLCCVGFLVYGVNPANFHQTDINGSMAKAVGILFGCLIIPFGFSIFATYRNRASLKREFELVKTLPVEKKKPASPAPVQVRGIAFARGLILSLAVILLVYGYFAGGTADVLTKAINICTECVGLG